MVIFLFLRNVSATMIPSLALPFSVVGTFAVMYLLDYSLDNLSMMALILSVGFVVDDAIVMLENIVRHMEMGKARSGGRARRLARNRLHHRVDDAVAGRRLHPGPLHGRHPGPPVPRIRRHHLRRDSDLRRGVRHAHPHAVQPLPAAASHEAARSWFYRVTEGFFDGMLRMYDHSLRWVLRHRLVTLASFFVVLAATVALFVIVPKGFVPEQDTDQLAVITEATQGTAFQQMSEYQKQVAEIVAEDPDVDSLVATVGGPAASVLGGPNIGQLVVHLKPRSQRKLLVGDIMERLRPQVASVPGVRVYLQNPPVLRIGGQVTKSLYQFTLQSPDKPELYAAAEALEKELDKEPALIDVTSDLQIRYAPSSGHHRPRQSGRAPGQRPGRREYPLRRLRPPLGLHHLLQRQRVQGPARTPAEVSDRPHARCRCSISSRPPGS